MSYYKKKLTDDIFTGVKTFQPKETFEWLTEMSAKLKIPVSRLIAIAVDNERDQGENAFYYPCEYPTTTYKEYAFASEAGKIADFLGKTPNGTSVDSLMLARRDIGIPSRGNLMGGLRELFEKDMIEEYTPKRTVYNYGREYTRIRLKGELAEKVKKTKFKRVEGASTKYQKRVRDKDVE